MNRRRFLTLLSATALTPVVAKVVPVVTAVTVVNACGSRTTRVRYDLSNIRDRNVIVAGSDYAGAPIATFRGIPIRLASRVLLSAPAPSTGPLCVGPYTEHEIVI